jgi:putative transposase
MSPTADARSEPPRYRRAIARPLRSDLPPRGVYHVTARGVAHCEVFRDDVDRKLFLARMRRLASELSWKCFLYCLMTTHYHLLVATSLERLSSGMQRLQGPYAQQFNAKYARVGHLFEDRFYARVVRDELLFQRAYDYNRNNPGAAGL